MNHQKIFSLTVRHDYFKNGESKNLQILPDDRTKQLLEKNHFILQTRSDGIALFRQENSPDGKFIEQIPDFITDHFTFILDTPSREFLNFTEMPMDEMGKLFFSNISLKQPSETGPSVLKTTYASRMLPKGIGSIRLYFNELQKETPPDYAIEFRARKVLWEYYITNLNADEIINFRLGGEHSDKFEDPVPATLPNGQASLLFSSGSYRFPLSEFPDFEISLLGSTSQAAKSQESADQESQADKKNYRLLVKSLPHPSPLNLTQKNGHLYGPVFVFI